MIGGSVAMKMRSLRHQTWTGKCYPEIRKQVNVMLIVVMLILEAWYVDAFLILMFI